MGDVTSWDPGQGADLVGLLQNEGRAANEVGEQAIHAMTQLTGDGLLGVAADGSNQLASAIHAVTQGMDDTTKQVASHVGNYGENMTGLDTKYGGLIAGQ